MVDEPAGLLLKQRAVGVHVNSLLVLHSLVASFAQSGRVIEISCSHRLQEGEDKKQRRADGLIKQGFLALQGRTTRKIHKRWAQKRTALEYNATNKV